MFLAGAALGLTLGFFGGFILYGVLRTMRPRAVRPKRLSKDLN